MRTPTIVRNILKRHLLSQRLPTTVPRRRFTDSITSIDYPGLKPGIHQPALFVAVMIYLVKALKLCLQGKRDAIRPSSSVPREKQSALKHLTSAEAKLAALENEKADILKKAREEAEAEKIRLAEQAELEVKKLREQTGGELSRMHKVTMARLRRFSAEESVRLAEEKLLRSLNFKGRAIACKSGIASIGG